MYNYEKKYWSKDEYTLNGYAYEGYVGIRNNNAYIYDTNEILEKNKSFGAQFNSGKNFFDRILDEDLSLPYSKKEIQYQNNDFLHKNTLKTIVKNLSMNNDYIFKCSTIGNTTLPVNEKCIIYTPSIKQNGMLDGNFLDSRDFTTKIDNFDNITASDMCIVDVEIVGDEKRVTLLLFFAYNNEIKIIRHYHYPNSPEKSKDTPIDFNNALTINKVDVNKRNSIEYLDIKAIKVKGNYLYVVDEKLHMVVRYDIEFLRTSWVDGEENEKNIRVIDIVQGEGTVEDQAYFKSPCAIDADDNYIYVADAGNGCIKKYTTSFDYVDTLWNVSLGDQKFQEILINPFSFTLDDGTRIPANTLWVFTITSNFLYIYIIYDNLMIFSRRIEKVKLLDDEEFRDIRFSFNNSNYYYICTTRRIFKLHMTKPFYPFASVTYKRQRKANVNIQQMTWNNTSRMVTTNEYMNNKAFCLCGCDKYTTIKDTTEKQQFDGDIILHIGEFYDNGQLKQSGAIMYTENTSFISSLGNHKFSTYLLEDMEDIHHDEYINPQTFNKLIYKLVHNLMGLKSQIIGRFVGAYNTDGIMVFDQLEYDDFFKELQINDVDNMFVHENEPISIMINRIFEKIYDTQERLLEHLVAKYRAISTFTNDSIREI